MALADDDVHFTLDHTITWQTFAEPVDIRILVVDARATVDLAGEVSYDDWQHLEQIGGFHLDGQRQPHGWVPELPIQISLRLRAPVTAEYDDAEQFLHTLFTEADGPLRHSEAWLLTEAMQHVPVPDDPSATSAVGFRTNWADPIDVD